jgi:hypothetical protein
MLFMVMVMGRGTGARRATVQVVVIAPFFLVHSVW